MLNNRYNIAIGKKSDKGKSEKIFDNENVGSNEDDKDKGALKEVGAV